MLIGNDWSPAVKLASPSPPKRPPKRKRGPGSGRDPWKRICYTLRQRPSYFAACLRAERTAASMALLVTVAPATPSIWALWAASTCWA